MTKRKLENDLKDSSKPKKLKLKDKEHNSLVRGEVNALPAIPGLCIINFGEIPLPISEIQAESLAKFLDESKEAHKRPNENVYELKPSEIEIKNKIWKRNLSILTSKLAPELGHKSKTEAKFNKLLFFTKGASLKREKDELKEHQFATLIIQLPSCFTGGDLVVYGKNSHKRCDFGLSTKKAPFSVHYAAYNSDYEREVMEVKSGCRFFLVYDLCLAAKKVELSNNVVNVNDFFIGFLPWIEMQLMVNLEHKNNAYHDEHALRTLESLIRNRNLRLAQDFIGNVLRRFSKTMCPCIAGLIKLFGWHPLQTCISRFLIPIKFENFSVNCCLVQVCLFLLTVVEFFFVYKIS